MDDRKILAIAGGFAVTAISIASIVIFLPKEKSESTAVSSAASKPATSPFRPQISSPANTESPKPDPVPDKIVIDEENYDFDSEMKRCAESDAAYCEMGFSFGKPNWIDSNKAELLSSKWFFEGRISPLVYQIKKRFRQQILSAIIHTNIDQFFDADQEHVIVGYHNGLPGILIHGAACPSVFNSQRTTPRTRMASVVGSILIKSLEESAFDLQNTECKWIGISTLIPVKDFGEKEASTSVDCGVIIAKLDDCQKIRDNEITDQKFVDSCEIYYSGNDTGKELRRISVTME